MKTNSIYFLFSFLTLTSSCGSGQKTEESAVFSNRETVSEEGEFDLHDIQDNGELIVLTLYGPYSYFEFRGENFGSQYMLVDEYANSIGVSLRIEVCRSTKEMLDKLRKGDGDIIAYNLPVEDLLKEDVTFCGQKQLTAFLDTMSVMRGDSSIGHKKVAWAVRESSTELASSLSDWMIKSQKDFISMTTIRHGGGKKGYKGHYYPPRRKVAAPILNLAKGQISIYDNLFRQYSKTCGWDWRLIAAQAYQESGFDPNAVSWMGALGLMQLMPSTARDVGVGENDVFVPERNLQGAVRLINQLNNHYSDIKDGDERINFILAAYNAGPGHVDDARAMCRKNGADPNVWKGNVDTYVLRMSEARYFNDPVVSHGYFRGSETYSYVNSIRARWDEYMKKIAK